MALSPLALEIIKLIGTAASGGLALEVARWLLGKRSRQVDDISKLGSTWQELVNEFQEERQNLRKELCDLQTWRREAETLLNGLKQENQDLKIQISGLQREREEQELKISNMQERNEGMEKRVSALERENESLRVYSQGLMLRLANCLEAQNGQRKTS